MSQYSSALWRRITSKIKIQQATSSLLFTSATLRDFATCWKLGLADPFRNSFHMSYLPEIFNVQIDKGPTFAKKWPSSCQFGGNVNFFITPKVNAAGEYFNKGRPLMSIHLCF